jgi:hypothetical protein
MTIGVDVYRCRKLDATKHDPELIVMILPCPSVKDWWIYLAYLDYGTAISLVFNGSAPNLQEVEERITYVLAPWSYDFSGRVREAQPQQ